MPEGAPTDPMNEVTPQPIPGAGYQPAATPAAFGGGIAQAVEGISSEVRHYALMEKRYNDQEVTQDRVNQAQMKRLDLYDNLRQQQYQNPEELHNAVDKAKQDFEDHLKTVESTLYNDHQRAQFARYARSERFNMDRSAAEFALKEQNRMTEQTYKSTIKVLQRSVTSGDMDPETGKPVDHIEQIKNAVQTFGTRLRWNQDVIDNQKEIEVGNARATVLNTMIGSGQDIGQAKAYFDAHGSEMSTQAQQHFETRIDNITRDQKAGDIYQGLVKKHVILGDSDVSVDKAYEDLEKSPELQQMFQRDPKLGTEVHRLLGEHTNNLKIIKQAREDSLSVDSHQALEKAHWDYNSMPEEIKDRLVEFPDMADKLRNFGYSQIQREAKPITKDAARDAKNTSVATRWDLENILNNPQTFHAVTQAKVIGDLQSGLLTDEDAAALRKRIEEGPKSVTHDESAMMHDLVEHEAKNIGLHMDKVFDPNKSKDVEEAAQVSSLRDHLYKTLDNLHYENRGKPLTRDQIMDGIRSWTRTVDIGGEKIAVFRDFDDMKRTIPLEKQIDLFKDFVATHGGRAPTDQETLQQWQSFTRPAKAGNVNNPAPVTEPHFDSRWYVGGK